MKIRDMLAKYTEDIRRYISSKLSIADSTVVHKSGDETIGGTKTFSSDVYSSSSQVLYFRHLDGSNSGGMDGALFLNYNNSTKNVYFNGGSYYINGGYYNGTAAYASRSSGNGAFYISGYKIYVG